MTKKIVEQTKYVTEKFEIVGYGVPKRGQYYQSLYDKRIYKADSNKDCIVNTTIFKKVK